MALPLRIETLAPQPIRRIDTGVHARPDAYRSAPGGVFASRPVRLSESVYRRRRVVAAAVAVVVLSFGMFAVRSINATRDLVLPSVPVSSQTVPSAVAPDAPGTLRGQVIQRGGTYVAQRGDTLWIIARSLKPQGELSGLIRQLVVLNGGPSLEVGQVVRLPR